MKAMLGPVSPKFDLCDNRAGKTSPFCTHMDPMVLCGCCVM